MMHLMSWRRSNTYQILVSLILPFAFSLNAMESKEMPWWKLPDEAIEQEEPFHGSSYKEIKHIYERAPKMIHHCVRHLNDPNFYKLPEYRVLVLYGPSGSGKSTLLKAIAAYSGWDLEFKTPEDIQGHERGKGAENMRELIDDVVERKTNTVIGFDEFNQWLEHAESEHHDNDATAIEFWTQLNKLNGKKNVFIVCTANRLHKIPKQVKSRIAAFSCFIEGPKTIKEKKDALLFHLKKEETIIDPKSHKTIEYILQNNPTWTGRDYAHFSATCKIVSREKDENSTIMKFDDDVLKQALEREHKFHQDSKFTRRDLSADERQELHFAQDKFFHFLELMIEKSSMGGGLPIFSASVTFGLKEQVIAWLIQRGLTEEQAELLTSETGFSEDAIKEFSNFLHPSDKKNKDKK